MLDIVLSLIFTFLSCILLSVISIEIHAFLSVFKKKSNYENRTRGRK